MELPCEEPFMLPIRIRRTDVETHTYEDVSLPLVDPHRLVDYLFTDCGLEIPTPIVHRFWEIKRNLARESWALHSPATMNHIPIAIYGDACTIKGNAKMLGIFLSFPLWRAKSTRCSRWLLCGIEESKLWGTDTLNCIMKRITFSLNLLFDGWDCERGVQLAGGRVYTVTELRGDWLWHKQVWNFSSTWQNLSNLCYRCDCKGRSRDSKTLYWNIDEGEWHEYSRAEFMVHQLGECKNPCNMATLLALQVFLVCSLEGIDVDWGFLNWVFVDDG